jgi:hypothetical protein
MPLGEASKARYSVATMPKIAVAEYSDLLFRKNNIRAPQELLEVG